MSMAGNIGASCAAEEILKLIQTKKEENIDKPEVVKVLEEVEAKAKEIKDSADSGWY
jgi:hypothetical protein